MGHTTETWEALVEDLKNENGRLKALLAQAEKKIRSLEEEKKHGRSNRQ